MKNVERAMNIAAGLSIGAYNVEKTGFDVCCIGCATTLSMYLTGQKIPHKHDGVRFVFLVEPLLVEPRITAIQPRINMPDNWCKIIIWFDRSVSEYCMNVTKIGDDDGLEQYQEAIEEVEHRVATGIFGASQPERISVEWDIMDRLIIMWQEAS